MAIRKSYVKALAEPLTNSDDSYRRLEEEAAKRSDNEYGESQKQVVVFVTRKSREFEVVDYAEGLGREDFIELFTEYGEEKRTHFEKGRGLFGQGLSDVLLTQEYGGVARSIKNGLYTKATFKWRTKKEKNGEMHERPTVKIENSSRASSEFRAATHIPSGNGTNVSFRFAGAAFPTKEKLVEKLSNFYMLRFINSNPRRKVQVVFLDTEGGEESSDALRYSFPVGRLLGKIGPTTIGYEGFKIGVEGELYKGDDPLPQREVGMEDRQGGILVFDENNNVLDLTLFGYDGNPFASKLFGRLRLIGVYQFIREKLRRHEEILTDTRDGFIRGHPFFQALEREINPWLAPFVEDEKKAQTAKTSLSEGTLERQKKAFDVLNKLYKEMIEETKGFGGGAEGEVRPENGLEFDRQETWIAVEKRYWIGLRIDTSQIAIGTAVGVARDSEFVEFSPSTVVVEQPAEGKVVDWHRIYVKGKKIEVAHLIASVRGRGAGVILNVVREEPFTPVEPMEFHPKESRCRPNNWGNLDLFVDTGRIAIGSILSFGSSNSDVIVRPSEATVVEMALVNNRIAKLAVEFRGSGEGQKSTITAIYGEVRAEAYVKIASREPPPAGIFKDWKFEKLESKAEVYFDPADGYIRINLNHPLNQKVFGDDPEAATEAYEKSLHYQMRVFELILSECLYIILSKAYEENKVDRHYQEAPWQDIKVYIDEKKREIGESFFESFVDARLLKSAEKSVDLGVTGTS